MKTKKSSVKVCNPFDPADTVRKKPKPHKIKLSVFNLLTNAVIGTITVDAGDLVSVTDKKAPEFKDLGLPHFELSDSARAGVNTKLSKLADRNKIAMRHVAAYADVDYGATVVIVDARIERLRYDCVVDIDAQTKRVDALRAELSRAEKQLSETLCTGLGLREEEVAAKREKIFKAKPRVVVINGRSQCSIELDEKTSKVKKNHTSEDNIANRNRRETAKQFALANGG